MKTTSIITLGVAALGLTQIWAKTGEWPQYHGAGSDRATSESIANKKWPAAGPKQLWKVPTNAGFSSFTIAEGLAFTLVSKSDEGIEHETCVALDAATGKEKWSAKLGLTRYGHTGGGRGAPDNSGGDGPRSTPAYADGKIYVTDADLNVYCFDAKTGKEAWRHSVEKEFGGKNIKWKNAAAPLVESGHIFVAGGGTGEAILCFEAKTGKVVWKKHSFTMTHATPIAATIHGKRQLIFFVKEGLVSIDPKSGDEIWFQEFDFRTSTAAAPVVWNDIVYCSAGYGVGAGAYRIKKDNTVEELWRKEGELENHWSTPLVKDGYLYGMFGFKKYGTCPVKCVDIRTGEVKWSQDGFGPGNVIRAGGDVLALGDAGQLVVIEAKPDAYKEHARANILDGKCWSTAVLAGGKIYARSTKEAVCLDVSK